MIKYQQLKINGTMILVMKKIDKQSIIDEIIDINIKFFKKELVVIVFHSIKIKNKV